MFPDNIQSLESNEADEKPLREIVVSEIQLEIDLRNRLAQTVESRIAWATSLQEALLKGGNAENDSATFKMAALDALSAIEEPSKLFFDHETIHTVSSVPVAKRAVAPGRKNRVPPRESRATRSRQRAKFLYTCTDNQTNVLTCPECQRTQFSSIQGLYNHARITHQLEWGNHDDCVRACSVPRDDLDLSEGTEVALTLLGVRGLFERAVEGPSPLPVVDAMDVDEPSADPEATNHISRTLGFHAETVALASVLGKEVKRREIRARNEDEDVDIDSLDNKRSRWYMPWVHRSLAKPGSPREGAIQAPPNVHGTHDFTPDAVGHSSIPGMQPNSSRFHIAARVVVTDRSLHLGMQPEETNYTHKWMLSVEAPSYSINITTILKRITVTSLSDYHIFSPLSVVEPPFVVVGAAARPFLAKIDLLFSHARGQDSQGQRFVLEHWVDLSSPRPSRLPVKGEEQVVDIELDKETVFFPARINYVAVNAKEHWQRETGIDPADFVASCNLTNMAAPSPSSFSRNISETEKSPKAAPSEIGYPVVIRDLLPSFPITLADVVATRGTAPPTVPYMLVATPNEFHGLVLGRRKAIEWGRASAVREAYTQLVKETRRELELDRLSTADVFCWLESEGLFLRTNPSLAAKPKTQATDVLHAGRWCTACGLVSRVHVTGDGPFACHIIPTEWRKTRIPIVDLDRILATPQTVSLSGASLTYDKQYWNDAQVVRTSNPKMLRSIKEVVRVLNLPTFSSSEGGLSIFAIDKLGRDASKTTQTLAPYGVLALAAERFIMKLVSGGLQVSSRFQHQTPGEGWLLTPMHVVQGVVDGKDRDQTGLAIFYALARIGRRAEMESPDGQNVNIA